MPSATFPSGPKTSSLKNAVAVVAASRYSRPTSGLFAPAGVALLAQLVMPHGLALTERSVRKVDLRD